MVVLGYNMHRREGRFVMRLTEKEAKSAKIAEIIRKELAAGRLRPGDKLEGEYGLAERFGVGRQVIRSAFQLLKRENLIRSARGSGVYVNDYIPETIHTKLLRIGYVYWRGMPRENSFLHGYKNLLRQAKSKGCEIYLAWEEDEMAGFILSGFNTPTLGSALKNC